MTENTMAHLVLTKGLLIITYSYLYNLGGSDVLGKWARRFVAPFVLCIGFVSIGLIFDTFHWGYAVTYPLYMGAAHLGYGKNSKLMRLTKSKIVSRGTCGAAFGVAALPIAVGHDPAVLTGIWGLYACHFVLSVASMIVLGVWNINRNSRDEEFVIAMGHSTFAVFMA